MPLARTAPLNHSITIVAVEEVVVFDLGTPSQVFGAAVDQSGAQLYDTEVCTAGGRPVRTSAGFSVDVSYDLATVANADTVIVPGVAGTSAAAHGAVDEAVLAALREASARGSRLVSICTGAFVLAAAGLLDGRAATTHWRYADRFRRLYPDVRLDADVLFVDETDVLTSAGVAAGIDLCLHIVRTDHGAAVANRAARRCVVAPLRTGGQAQFIERPHPEYAATSLAPVREWALTRLDAPLDLSDLAREAAVSVRTLTRRWREETGQSPLQWLLTHRIQLARDLLEDTDLSVDQVAQGAGLGSAASLRGHLHAAVGQTPTLYRRSFGTG